MKRETKYLTEEKAKLWKRRIKSLLKNRKFAITLISEAGCYNYYERPCLITDCVLEGIEVKYSGNSDKYFLVLCFFGHGISNKVSLFASAFVDTGISFAINEFGKVGVMSQNWILSLQNIRKNDGKKWLHAKKSMNID